MTDDVGQAVYQFFLNGGSQAYVYGLQAEFSELGVSGTTSIEQPSLQVHANGSTAIVFAGLEPTDALNQITVSIAGTSRAPA